MNSCKIQIFFRRQYDRDVIYFIGVKYMFIKRNYGKIFNDN